MTNERRNGETVLVTGAAGFIWIIWSSIRWHG